MEWTEQEVMLQKSLNFHKSFLVDWLQTLPTEKLSSIVAYCCGTMLGLLRIKNLEINSTIKEMFGWVLDGFAVSGVHSCLKRALTNRLFMAVDAEEVRLVYLAMMHFQADRLWGTAMFVNILAILGSRFSVLDKEDFGFQEYVRHEIGDCPKTVNLMSLAKNKTWLSVADSNGLLI